MCLGRCIERLLIVFKTKLHFIHIPFYLHSIPVFLKEKKKKSNSTLLQYEHYVPFENVHINGRERKKVKTSYLGKH